MQALTVQHEFNLVSNMDEVKASIAETISKYDVVVSEDRLGEAKELMATFNKDKKAFSDKCKEFLVVIGEPIAKFKESQKEIEKIYDDGRAKIADQVAKFEAKKLIEIKEAVRLFRDAICCEKNINPDSVIVDDLVMLSAVTSGSNLSKKTKESIDARIQAVENEILKARIEAEEKAKRDREIAEKARIEAEARARVREAELIANAEREKHEALAKAKREQDEAVAQYNQIHSETTNKTTDTMRISKESLLDDCVVAKDRTDGKRVFIITAQFEILAPAQTPHEKITDKLKTMIESSGITSLKSIEVA